MTLEGFVLAGGASRRMGVDKARVPFPHRWPMAAWVAERLAAVCDRVALVRRAPDDDLPWRFEDGTPIEVVLEPDPGDRHPLWGVVTALRACRGEAALVLPCDLPWITVQALQALARAPGFAVASDGSRPQPLVGRFPVSLLDEVERAAREGVSARRFAASAEQVALPAAALRDLDRWEEAGVDSPVRTLLQRLPWLTGDERARVARAEIHRLRSRGALEPDLTGYGEPRG